MQLQKDISNFKTVLTSPALKEAIRQKIQGQLATASAKLVNVNEEIRQLDEAAAALPPAPPPSADAAPRAALETKQVELQNKIRNFKQALGTAVNGAMKSQFAGQLAVASAELVLIEQQLASIPPTAVAPSLSAPPADAILSPPAPAAPAAYVTQEQFQLLLQQFQALTNAQTAHAAAQKKQMDDFLAKEKALSSDLTECVRVQKSDALALTQRLDALAATQAQHVTNISCHDQRLQQCTAELDALKHTLTGFVGSISASHADLATKSELSAKVEEIRLLNSGEHEALKIELETQLLLVRAELKTSSDALDAKIELLKAAAAGSPALPTAGASSSTSLSSDPGILAQLADLKRELNGLTSTVSQNTGMCAKFQVFFGVYFDANPAITLEALGQYVAKQQTAIDSITQCLTSGAVSCPLTPMPSITDRLKPISESHDKLVLLVQSIQQFLGQPFCSFASSTTSADNLHAIFTKRTAIVEELRGKIDTLDATVAAMPSKIEAACEIKIGSPLREWLQKIESEVNAEQSKHEEASKNFADSITKLLTSVNSALSLPHDAIAAYPSLSAAAAAPPPPAAAADPSLSAAAAAPPPPPAAADPSPPPAAVAPKPGPKANGKAGRKKPY